MKKVILASLILTFSLPAYADGDAKYLDAGTPAPFAGFLITPDKANKVRLMDIDLAASQHTATLQTDEIGILNERLNNARQENVYLSEQIQKARSDGFFTKATYFVVGAVITGAISYACIHTLH